MINTIKVGKRKIGNNQPVFVIAEIGINHEGNIKRCAQMIKAAADAGVDAVKLQTIDADANYVKNSESYKIFKGAELNVDETKKMFQLAKSFGVEIFTTVGDFDTLNWVNELEPCAWKISSGLITHIPLIEKMAKFNRPILISTGMSDLNEIKYAVNASIESGKNQIGIFQCTSIYPVNLENIYLSRIGELKRIFNVPIGFSDHSLGSDAAFLSVGAGASMIEKHFTFDKGRKGYDHAISMNKKEMKELVNKVRLAEIMVGNRNVRLEEFQKGKRETYLRCIVAKKNIQKGDFLTEENITIKRPKPGQRGLEPKNYNSIINNKADCDIPIDSPIIFDMIIR